VTANAKQDQPILLEVKNLKTWFPIRRGILQRTVGHVKAVDDVSLFVRRGETLGLVGESGCGKTTVGRTILRLIPNSGGSVRFDGRDVLTAGALDLRNLRREMQIIFQDPGGSLNPRMRVRDILAEPIRNFGLATDAADRERRVGELMDRVRLPRDAVGRWPHEFSGGQRQRIGIARALAVQPELIVCDEPVSALDVSVQASVVNLLQDLQDELGVAYLFIAHDLAVVEHISHHVLVMERGKVVEQGSPEQILRDPQHPYTRTLLEAVPKF
jgi:ABC-type oligopeptide transport system ATPase subunit